MNLDYIGKKLNEIFEGYDEDFRQIVFWYDDKAEFGDEINNLKLENAQIYHLKEDNWLFTKYFMEIEDQNTNYLIYAPFSRPNDEDNFLADMAYYATQFYADKISIISQELSIPNELKPILKNYTKFWNANSRVNSFQNLDIENYSEENINIAILCVLTNVKVLNFDEILKKVLTEDSFDENKFLLEFEKMDILNVFWKLCQEKYGYIDKKPSIEKFWISLLLTYTSTKFQGSTPKAWNELLSKKKNNITVFINNLMGNADYKDQYDHISSKIAEKINLLSSLEKIPVDMYYSCDAFEIFDKNIIEHLTDMLVSNLEEIPSIPDILEERKKTHFYKKYLNYYEIIKWANLLIKLVNEFSNEHYNDDVKDFIDNYCDKWYLIDTCYRKFYYSYDKISNQDKLNDLKILIENIYSNSFLSKLAMLWSDKLRENGSINNLPISKQYNFFKNNVKNSILIQKTAVIISDAFRYELADDFKEKLSSSKLKCTVEINPIVSSVPSFTSLGMACLLPHKKIKFDRSFKVLVDGKPCSSTVEREKILKKYHSNAITLTYDDVMSLKMHDLRKKLKNKDLVYIYHNQIDARGDKLATENEIFNASKEAIDELVVLIKKLTNQGKIFNTFLTSDHGFVYKRNKLNESDKVDLSKKGVFVKNKRYLLSKENLNIDGTLDFSLDYLGIEDFFVTVPIGIDVFKIQGAGQNYVHGGASLQEIILPLINIKSKTASKNQRQVKVQLISFNRITNLSTILKFVQNENLSAQVLPLEVLLYFEDENGAKISNEVIIYANKKVESSKEREFKEKFTLMNKKYSKKKKYYLVMKDLKTEFEIARHEFIIDIAILDDFMI